MGEMRLWMGEGREGGRSGMTTSGKSSRYKKREKEGTKEKRMGGVWLCVLVFGGREETRRKGKNRNKGRLGDFADC